MKLHERSATLDVDTSPQAARDTVPRSTRTSQRFTPRRAPDAISKNRIQPAALATLLASASCASQISDSPVPQSTPPALEQSTNALTIADLNPPPAPLVLPLANGATVRISERAGEDFSHNNNATRHAVDFSINGNAVTPMAGVVHFRSGNCVANDNLCRPNNGCNGGWGNVVELDGIDGNTYISAHCFAFQPGLNDGNFVGRGTPVCTIGCSGNATGNHLHFDRVNRNGNSYTSVGVPSYIIYTAGNPGATIETPDTFRTCCNGDGCDAVPGTPECTSYTSLNHSTLNSLSTFARTLVANRQIVSVTGGFSLDQQNSNAQYSLYTQNADVLINGNQTATQIAFMVGDFYGTGARNPFIDTAYSFYYNPNTNQWDFLNYHTTTTTEQFINFDLWDFARVYLLDNARNQIGIPQDVTHMADWDANWELHSAEYELPGGRQFTVYLAVYKNIRGVRFALAYENNTFTQWAAL